MIMFTVVQFFRWIAAVRIPIWLLVACFGLFSMPNLCDHFNPRPVTKAFSQRQVVEQVSTICNLHRRLWISNPIDQPETFFDVLVLDPTKHPFASPSWLTEGEMMHDTAVRRILRHWADRRKRLAKSDTGGERHHHLDQVAQVLCKPPMAKVYMAIFLPKIQHTRGDERLKALEDYCGNFWGPPPSFQPSDYG